MLELSQAPKLIQAINQAIEQNQQQILNLQAGLDLLFSKQNYLGRKLEDFDNVAQLTVSLLYKLLQMNDQKNQLELGNQGLRQDLCEICMINTQLQDQVFEKQKQLEEVQKQFKNIERKNEKLQKEVKVLIDKNDDMPQKFSAFYELSEDKQSIIIPDSFEGIKMIQSRIQAYPSQKSYDQMWSMRIQIDQLKATITRLTAVISFMEQRQQLRRQQDELRIIELEDLKLKNQIQVSTENSSQNYRQDNKEEVENIRTLAYSKSSLSLAEDIIDLDNEQKTSENSIRKKIEIIRSGSAPCFETDFGGYFKIQASKQFTQKHHTQNLPVKNIQPQSTKQNSFIQNNQIHDDGFVNKLWNLHAWLKSKIITERIQSILYRDTCKNYME